MPRARNPRLPQIVAAMVAALFGLTIFYGGRVYRWATERLDAPENLDEIDLKRVHAELFPEWVIALNYPKNPDGEAEAFEALRHAVEADDNLAALVDRLRAVARSGQLADHADRALDLLAQWNAYLDEHDKPFQLSGGVLLRDPPMLWATSVETLADLRVDVGERDVRARIFQRVDPTNIVEPYLGAAEEGIDGAVILTDRVLEFALDRVWPLLDPSVADDDLPPTARPFAAAVRPEVEAGLDADALKVLRRTAASRLAAVSAVEAIRGRMDCSRFILHPLPWSGLSPRDLDVVEHVVDDWAECPPATSGELVALQQASKALADEPELRAAVEALLAWTTRVIVTHEARHIGDVVELGSLEAAPACSICDERDGPPVRREVSAYVASFAWSDAPTTAFFQACDAIATVGGAHRRAMAVILEAAETSCLSSRPLDPATMKELEQWAFDRSEAIDLPGGYPSTLPLPPRQP